MSAGLQEAFTFPRALREAILHRIAPNMSTSVEIMRRESLSPQVNYDCH